MFVSRWSIGMPVASGDAVATIDGTVLASPLTGHLRGLTRSGVLVRAGIKVVEIDPRGTAQFCFGLGERPLNIADGVACALGLSSIID